MADDTHSYRTSLQVGPPTVGAAALQGFPTVPGYEVVREIGRGGMGVVYEARQSKLNRKVALKLMKGEDPLHKARFLGEGQVIAAIKHPHVVEVYDFGESSVGPYIAMEYLTGGTLSALLAGGASLAPRLAAAMIGQVASGVGAVHELGIVHRDLKPSNVLIDSIGAPKVADFGLAKRTASELTQTQEAAGTPAYMAPEQARAMKFVGPPADVWSLGVMLYESLTGKRPFAAETDVELLLTIQNDDPPTLRTLSKGIPPDLETICLKCLEKEPERRYAGAKELAADLRAWLDGEPIAARRATRLERAMLWVRRKPTVAAAWAMGLLVVLFGSLALFAVSQWQSAEHSKTVAEASRDLARIEKGNADEARLRAEMAEDTARKAERTARKAEDEAVKDRELARKSAKMADEQKALAESLADKATKELIRSQESEIRAKEGTKLAQLEAERATKALEDERKTKQKLESANSIVMRLADATENQKKSGKELQALLAAKDHAAAGPIFELYRSPPPLLLEKEFRTAAAAYLANSAIVVQTGLKTPEEILDGDWKPYAANPQSLAWLKKADELDGRDHPEWAVHLYLLAIASNDSATAQAAARRVVLDDAKLAKAADLPFAMAYFRGRAADPSADQSSRLAAAAATARLAYRLMEATFDPKQDAKAREDALLPRIAAYARKGLELPGGNNVDRLSLQLSIFRKELYSAASYNQDWLAKHVPEIDALVRALPANHPDAADARAYRSFATLMRFSNAYGDLNRAKAKEPERIAAWDAMVADAEAALLADPENGYANRALGMALVGTFKEFTPVYPPPDARKTADFVKDRERTLDADRHLKLATDALKTRPLPALWRMRSVFLFQAANEFAKAGESPADVRQMLRDAALSAQSSDVQRAEAQRLIDDPLLLGRIQEALAWLAQDRPAENYEAVIGSLTLAANRSQTTADQRLQNVRCRLDLARTVVRAVMFGHFPIARLAEADRALEAMKADILKLPDAERESFGVKFEQAKGIYWRGRRQLLAGDVAGADRTLAEAAEALRPYAADLHAFSLVYRAEAALAADAPRDGKVVVEMAERLKALVEADGDGALRQTLAFVPDYLLARKALDGRDAAAARTHFAAAFDRLEKSWKAKTLLVEDSFALRGLALELLNVDLPADAKARRRGLLAEFEKVFAWSLTPADRELVANALKK